MGVEIPSETCTKDPTPARGPLFLPIERVLPMIFTFTALELELAL